MITTTLLAIRAHSPCPCGWQKLLAHLGKRKADEEPLPLLTVLESNGLYDTLWCFRALGSEHNRWMRGYAVWCARQVQHLMTDPRSLAALDVAERYANGDAADDERSAAAASAASAAAWSAESAARSAQANRLLEVLRDCNA